MSLQEMCGLFEVTPRTLRYYEYIELLTPRRNGRKRLYGPRERARLTLILRGRKFGFSLEEIRQWLLLYNRDQGNSEQLETWIDKSGKQLDELEKRKSEIQLAIDELAELRDQAVAFLEGKKQE